MISQKVKNPIGKTMFFVIGWIHSPNPYKTCRLLLILEPISQKHTREHQKSIVFISILWCTFAILETLDIAGENLLSRKLHNTVSEPL